MTDNNVGNEFVELMRQYPTVSMVGFSGFTKDEKTDAGSIVVVSKDPDDDKLAHICNLLAEMYEKSEISEIGAFSMSEKSLICNTYYKKGVDW